MIWHLFTLCGLAVLLAQSTAAAPQMAITFDDLPSHGELPTGMSRVEIATSILGTLREQHLPPVMGFINGAKVAGEPGTLGVLTAWREAGQPLGNHTWAHRDLDDLTALQFEAEIAKDEPLLQELMRGEDWHWFRYPFLHEGKTAEKRLVVRGWLASHEYKVAEVTMEFRDYLWNPPYARCVLQRDEAAIAKLHDSYLSTADRFLAAYRRSAHERYGRDVNYVLLLHIGAFDAKMLPELLKLYRTRGFTFVTLAEAQNDPVYGEEPRSPLVPAAKTPDQELNTMCRGANSFYDGRPQPQQRRASS